MAAGSAMRGQPLGARFEFSGNSRTGKNCANYLSIYKALRIPTIDMTGPGLVFLRR
jgi:hypothetical protein